MDIDVIEGDMAKYKNAIQRLAKSINSVSLLWNDDHFSDLNDSVREIATTSRELIDIGENYCSIVKKFSEISEERF
jgi:hypothetical protein